MTAEATTDDDDDDEDDDDDDDDDKDAFSNAQAPLIPALGSPARPARRGGARTRTGAGWPAAAAARRPPSRRTTTRTTGMNE